MANLFSDIGFRFDQYDYADEIDELLENNESSKSQITTDSGSSLCLTASDGAQLWFSLIGGSAEMSSIKPFHRDGSYIKAKFAKWIVAQETDAKSLIKLQLERYIMNVEVPCPDIIELTDDELEIMFETVFFADTIYSYSDEDDFHENCVYGEDYAVRSFVPTGCYESFGNDSILQSSKAIVTGVVTSAEKLVNEFTQEEYYKILIESFDNSFTVFCDSFEIDEAPQAGSIILSTGRIFGRPVDIE